jgi:predicted RNA-binding Zn ribbon-like protein
MPALSARALSGAGWAPPMAWATVVGESALASAPATALALVNESDSMRLRSCRHQAVVSAELLWMSALHD